MAMSTFLAEVLVAMVAMTMSTTTCSRRRVGVCFVY
eukprot:SAG11_NODE_998_length_6237_cov_22.378299_3_plen_36_part_00